MDQVNWGTGQVVEEDELDRISTNAENAERNRVVEHGQAMAATTDTPDHTVYGGIHTGLAVSSAGASADYVNVTAGVADDNSGRRVELPSAATVKITHAGHTPEGDYTDAVPSSGAAITDSCAVGEYIVASLCIVYDEHESDPRTDDTDTPYNFLCDESFHFVIKIGTAFAAVTPGVAPSRAALSDGEICLADLVLQNVAGSMVVITSGVCTDDADWDALGAGYQEAHGRRADYLALDQTTDLPQFAAQATSIRKGTLREALYELTKLLQVQGATPSGADVIGARTCVGTATDYSVAAGAKTLTAGSVRAQLLQIAELLGDCLMAGGENDVAPSGAHDGVRFVPTLMGVDRNLRSDYAYINGSSSLIRAVKKHGHIVRAHEFFDDFFYVGDSNGHIQTQAQGMPWGFQAISGALGVGDNYALMPILRAGGQVDLTTKAAAGQGIAMISGYNAALGALGFHGWWNLRSPFASGMFRFSVSSVADIAIQLGFVQGGDTSNPCAVASFSSLVGTALYTTVRGTTGVAGATQTLVDPFLASTWYTVRFWPKDTTTMYFQVNNGEVVEAAVNAGDSLDSGFYDLYASVTAIGASQKALTIDQAYACDGGISSDMQ